VAVVARNEGDLEATGRRIASGSFSVA